MISVLPWIVCQELLVKTRFLINNFKNKGFVETLCWILYIFHFASIRPLKNDYREGFQQSQNKPKILDLNKNESFQLNSRTFLLPSNHSSTSY